MRGRLQRACMSRLRSHRRSVPDMPASSVPRKRPAASSLAASPAMAQSAASSSGAAAVRGGRGRLVPQDGPRKTKVRRLYPCCGHRRERCRCDWSPVEAHLDAAAWLGLVSRVRQGELKYAAALMFVSAEIVGGVSLPHVCFMHVAQTARSILVCACACVQMRLHAAQARDTSDVGVQLRNWRPVPGRLHSVLLGEEDDDSDFFNFVFACSS